MPIKYGFDNKNTRLKLMYAVVKYYNDLINKIMCQQPFINNKNTFFIYNFETKFFYKIFFI